MRINPLPFIGMAFATGLAYMLGGPTAAAWAALGYLAFIIVVSVFLR